ncbi:RNA helicase required for poly(A+) mRNA export, partial [Teratosphaeriaceae sp. CCFEE 6253]
MPDSKPLPSEPDSSNLAKSFADRMTFPSSDKKTNGTDPTANSFTPGKFNWADEVTTPVQEKEAEKVKESEEAPTPSKSKKDDDGSLGMAQTDGATTWTGGSGGLNEPEFDVNVKLADLQDDPNNPLYSIKTFDQLQL